MNAQELVRTDRFKSLVRKKWIFSLIMLALLFVSYFGYLFVVALNKELMIKLIAPNITLGMAVFAFQLFFAWALVLVYVFWANTSYDKEVDELKKMLK
jgi:uncharacterized membrane protein (DUF485 family)